MLVGRTDHERLKVKATKRKSIKGETRKKTLLMRNISKGQNVK